MTLARHIGTDKLTVSCLHHAAVVPRAGERRPCPRLEGACKEEIEQPQARNLPTFDARLFHACQSQAPAPTCNGIPRVTYLRPSGIIQKACIHCDHSHCPYGRSLFRSLVARAFSFMTGRGLFLRTNGRSSSLQALQTQTQVPICGVCVQPCRRASFERGTRS
jgi:hypothetical protein